MRSVARVEKPSVEPPHLINSALHACIMRILQKYAANRESMDTLLKYIKSMNTMIESILPKGRPCPSMLKEQLRIFSEYVYIFIPKPSLSASISSRWVNECVYRGVQSVTTAVARLQGGEDDTVMKKLGRGTSQTLRADEIADALDGYVKDLSWHINNLMVGRSTHTNRKGA